MDGCFVKLCASTIQILIRFQKIWRFVSNQDMVKIQKTGFAEVVVLDHMMKMRHLIPCNTNTGSEELTRLYLYHVRKLHSLPKTIISDCGIQFTSNFWKHQCSMLKIKIRLSGTFHLATDGQTERFNTVKEQNLRSFGSYFL